MNNNTNSRFKSFVTQDDFTVKVSTNKILLSKFIAIIKAQFKPLSTSRIFVNPSTRAYFVYLNFTDAEITEKLQEVSVFPKGA